MTNYNKEWRRRIILAAICLVVSACSTTDNNSKDGQSIVGHPSGNYHYVDENQERDFSHLRVDTVPESMDQRELLYVPVYTDIYIRNKEMRLPLTATLSIRNISVDYPMFVNAITYFDSDGKVIQKYLKGVVRLEPLQSIWLVVNDNEISGGTGANFIVDWGGAIECPKPIVESLMTGAAYQLGVSYKSESMVIKSWCFGEEKSGDFDCFRNQTSD